MYDTKIYKLDVTVTPSRTPFPSWAWRILWRPPSDIEDAYTEAKGGQFEHKL